MKTWQWIVICVLIVVAVVASSFTYVSKYTENVKSEYKSTTDSIIESHEKETSELQVKLQSVEEQYTAAISERDSLKVQLYSNTKTNKQLVRTVYRDSIKEVYVENTENVLMYETEIQHLRDSLNMVTAKQDGVEVKYIKEYIHDTIYVAHTTVDTVHTETKTEVTKQGKIGIYAGADAKYGQNGFGWDAEAGAKYYIIGPMYLKGGIEYSEGLNGVVGAGIDIRF